ncbi:MAG: hypothetical protein ABIS50_15310 [Luteolibacter sp.]|uniref:hypothetical protein n=1 Tax=Luteolibacter sp. TaxID=1962973 RepID=UPI003265924B
MKALLLLAAATSDPGAWILFAALVGLAVGVFATAIYLARSAKTARHEWFWEGYASCNRDHSKKTPKL